MSVNPPTLPQPRRGQVWFVVLPSDPPGKNRRPVVIVSSDARNTHPRATTVLVIPFSTTPASLPTHVSLQPGQTGLRETSTLQPENIQTVRKEQLVPAPGTKTVGESIIRRLARGVVLSMGVQPAEIPET
jgi:mRNA-degrading endonuclease toxin of MazEF toxin-antitoxin module